MRAFLECIEQQLAEKGFGPKRAEEIKRRFTNLAEDFREQGDPQFADRAMRQVFAEHEKALATKARLKQSDLAKMAERKRRLEVFDRNTAIAGDTNARADEGRPVIALLERDGRSGGINFVETHEAYFKRLWALANDAAERIGRGALGIRKGKLYDENLVRELLGEHTDDKIAQDMARGVRRALDVGVDLFNAAGGALEKLDNYLPQRRSRAKMLARGEDDFVRRHAEDGENPLAWDRIRYADGARVAPEKREAFLRSAYRTLVTDGRNKQDVEAFRGQGSSVGNQTDQHRVLIYKDADAWLAAHEAYGEGTILDVLNAHFDSLAHDAAMVQIFGSNPQMGFEQTKRMALGRADERVRAGEPIAVERTQQTLTKADKMFTVMARQNPLAVESTSGHLVNGASNVLTAALLGSVPLTGIADDFTKMGAMRLFNKMDLRPFQFLSDTLKVWLTDKTHMESMLTQSGFIAKEVVESNYAAQRYGLVSNYAPAFTRRLSDITMRMSGMAGWTKSARGAVQMEFMAMLARYADHEFVDTPWVAVMQRYGITPAEWDQLRGLDKYDMRAGKRVSELAEGERSGANWLRPIDALDQLGEAEGFNLFTKFQNMILTETRYAIPENSVEAQIALRDTTRPDSLAGAVLTSFAMYKNFPITQQLQYGRLAMSNPDKMSRLSFVAGLGLSMLGVGALAIQLKELAKGRDPLPMNTPSFFGKAMLAGGGLSIYGDYLFAGVNEYGQSGATQLGGPIFGALSEGFAAIRDDPLAWIDELAKGKALHSAKAPANLVKFAKHYTPGTSIWWSRLVLEREVWDRLAEYADPQAYKKMRAAVERARKQGNDYYWRPGAAAPERAPNFGGQG